MDLLSAGLRGRKYVVCLVAGLYVYLHLFGSLPKKGDPKKDPQILESLFKVSGPHSGFG